MDQQKLQVLETAQKLRLLPQLSGKVRALQQVYLTNPGLQAETERAILHLAEKHREQLLLEYPDSQAAKGDYPIGMVHCGSDRHPFCLQKAELLKHMCIYAMTGGGKSTALDVILWNLLKDKIPFIVFDWDGSHRHFLSRPEGSELRYFTLGAALCPLPFNPNRMAEGASYQQRLGYLSALYHSMTERHFQSETLTKEGVRFLLMRLAEELIKEGELDFTFKQLEEQAKNYRYEQREREWRTTLLNFLYRLTTGPIGQVFNSEAHIPPEVLLQGQSILSLERFLNPVQKADFIESFLYSLYENYLKPKQPIASPDEVRLVIVIEEIHHLADSILNSFFREMRKWGCGLVFTAQHPSLVSRQVRGNCHTTIAQNLESPEDLETMGETLLLDRRKLPYLGDEFSYLSRVKAGSGLYLTKLQSRYTKAFIQHIYPLPAIRKEITEEELKRRMVSYYQKLGLDLSQLLEKGEILQIKQWEERVNEIAESLGDKAKKLLSDVAHHPLAQVTERYDRLMFNGHRAKRELTEKGLLEQSSIANGHGMVVILTVTELGERVLEHLEHPYRPDSPGMGGGLDHEWLKDEVADLLAYELGWQNVRKEHVIGADARPRSIEEVIWSEPSPETAERVDIHGEYHGRKVAFEIETGKSHYLRNIFKCLRAGYAIVVSVAVNAEVKAKIQERLRMVSEAGVKLDGRVFVVHQGEVRDFVKGYLNMVL